ncbi:MAG: hypothetical protein WBX25_02225 [Rhodomicrobium sp.]
MKRGLKGSVRLSAPTDGPNAMNSDFKVISVSRGGVVGLAELLNAEMKQRLSLAQLGALERVIERARREAGRHSEELDGFKIYAYCTVDGSLMWGVNAPGTGFCVVRGVV